MDRYEVRLRGISDGVCGYVGVDGWPTLHLPVSRFEDEPPNTLAVTISAPGEPLVGIIEETGDAVGISDPPAEPTSKAKKETK